ncbi:MAG: hypothetical protein OEX00_02820 [Gammaproteobacteria bacterium]|nr:hypothetical protein [Gammaproteobacteria bacterium]MDH5693527.1 hypothetical protein [Gammaproteobacteria bacterium]
MNTQKFIKQILWLTTLLFVIGLLSACGSGASDASTPPATTPSIDGATGNKWDDMEWDKGKWG